MEVSLIDHTSKELIYKSSNSIRVRFRKDVSLSGSDLKRLFVQELRFNGINYLSLMLEGEERYPLQLEYSQPGYLVCVVLSGNHYTCQSLQSSVLITLNPLTRIYLINFGSGRTQGLNIIDINSRKLLPSMSGILSEIRQCTEDCPIQCIFIESKILSLLYLVFEEFQKEEFSSINKLSSGLSEKDIQKLRAAKVYIVQNIEKNYTIVELAHQVGLNDFKLKRGFKELFGNTVFTYRHSIRMEKAREMLKAGFQVNEVSEEIGYKHSHHFSAAFKEYFDISPSRIKG